MKCKEPLLKMINGALALLTRRLICAAWILIVLVFQIRITFTNFVSHMHETHIERLKICVRMQKLPICIHMHLLFLSVKAIRVG